MIHELLHTLGAMHTNTDDGIMYPNSNTEPYCTFGSESIMEENPNVDTLNGLDLYYLATELSK